MPQVVVFSDTHGNLPALRAVWKDAQKRRPAHVLFLGDVAAFGPQPKETLEFLRDEVKPTAAIRGNTDRYLLESVWKKSKKSELEPDVLDSLAWTAEKLGEDGLGYLDSLSGDMRHTVDGLPVYLCHASPGNDELGIGPETIESLRPAVQGREERVLLCGHTHVQFRTRVGRVEVLNVGSVGLPLDGDTRASYLSFFVGDGALRELTYCRVTYNRPATMALIEKSGMPMAQTVAHRLITARPGRPKPSTTPPVEARKLTK